MGVRSGIKHSTRILSNPDREFSLMNERSFEEILGDYILSLLATGLLAGAATLIYQFARAAYLDVFKSISVDYWNLLNYSVGTAVSIFFFYIFAGTFLMFIISLLIKLFARGIRYTRLLGIIMYSLSPLLVFSWIKESLFPALLVWSLFLLVKGIGLAKKDMRKGAGAKGGKKSD